MLHSPTLVSPLERLLNVNAPDRRVISCFLVLDPVRRNDLNYPLELKDLVREARRVFEESDPDRESRNAVTADLDRLQEFVAQATNLPHAPAAAVFICSSLGLFEVLPLPGLARSLVTIERRPALAGILQAEQESLPMLLIVADRTLARFFIVGPFTAHELPVLRHTGVSGGGRFHSDRGDAPGSGERSFHARREEEWHRHGARIWHRAGEVALQEEIRDVLLGGNRDDTDALERARPKDSPLTVRGRTRLNPTALTAATAFSAGSALKLEARRQEEEVLIHEMEEAVGSGAGVNGARETLRALNLGQLRTLLIPETQQGGGFRCPSTGELVLAAGDCRADSHPEPIGDLVSWIIAEAMTHGVDVRIVSGGEAAQTIDGMAGILRFR